MPLYEFICKACGQAFETLVGVSEKPVCPGCGSRKLEKQFSVFAVGNSSGNTANAAPESCQGCACGNPRGPGACGIN